MAILNDDEQELNLANLNNAWSIVGGSALERVVTVDDFTAATKLATKIGELANQHNHHPDLTLSYGKVVITLSTHSEGGLTEKDFKLAAELDELLG